jgi:hypothetical protein
VFFVTRTQQLILLSSTLGAGAPERASSTHWFNPSNDSG